MGNHRRPHGKIAVDRHTDSVVEYIQCRIDKAAKINKNKLNIGHVDAGALLDIKPRLTLNLL